nr:hypothetical protein [Rhizobium leguminosarum]
MTVKKVANMSLEAGTALKEVFPSVVSGRRPLTTKKSDGSFQQALLRPRLPAN